MGNTFKSFFFVVVCIFFYFVFCISSVSAYYTDMPASIVIGQTNFTSNGASTTGSTFSSPSGPTGILMIGSKLIICERGNNRVLIFNTVPTTNGASADVVIGQPDFIHGSANQGGSAGPNTLSNPLGLATDGTRLFISDSTNNRVLVYNTLPTTNNAPADMVIGQPDLNTVTIGSTASKIHGPRGIFIDPNTKKLFVPEGLGNRILIYNSIPKSNGASADVVIGQTDMTSITANQGGSVGPNTLSAPDSAYVLKDKLVVIDSGNNRVLIFNQIPTRNNMSAEIVMGQQDFSHNSSNGGSTVNQNGFSTPGGMIASDGVRLFISDRLNHRVLIFNQIPTTNNTPADYVLGQADFLHGSSNQGSTPTAKSFNNPFALYINENKLFVAEGNNRVMIFNNQTPDLTIARNISGQPNGKLRFSGTTTTNINDQIIKQVEYSINGSTWTGGFPLDGKFDSASEGYYFDFDPTVNTMADNEGFTVKVRSTHNNEIDTSKNSLYFEPFLANTPTQNTFTLNRLPTFSFNIQKVRFNDLKENLDHFRIMISKDNNNWSPYIDNIPVDYNSVRLKSDNFIQNLVNEKNGTFEDKFKTVKYEQENSVITVTSKSVDSQGYITDKYFGRGGTQLENGTYYWKVEAEDHAGQIQYTDSKILRIGTRQVVTSRSWFPLTIENIGGKGLEKPLQITSDQSPTYTSESKWPWFSGIAVADSTVTLVLKKAECKKDLKSSYYQEPILDSKGYCTRKYQTKTALNSRYFISIPWELIPDTYEANLSVKDTGDNYNEVPFEMIITTDNQSTTP